MTPTQFRDHIASLLAYNQETGHFTWLVRVNSRVPAGSRAGYHMRTRSRGMSIQVDGRVYRLSRLAWLFTYGEWPQDLIDHINGDPTDNRIANLREASGSENLQNRGKQKNNTSQHKGVMWDGRRGKWYARIRANKSRHYLGSFDTKEEAAAAYAKAATELHGAFARTE